VPHTTQQQEHPPWPSSPSVPAAASGQQHVSRAQAVNAVSCSSNSIVVVDDDANASVVVVSVGAVVVAGSEAKAAAICYLGGIDRLISQSNREQRGVAIDAVHPKTKQKISTCQKQHKYQYQYHTIEISGSALVGYSSATHPPPRIIMSHDAPHVRVLQLARPLLVASESLCSTADWGCCSMGIQAGWLARPLPIDLVRVSNPG
jgi:hypothetical protein